MCLGQTGTLMELVLPPLCGFWESNLGSQACITGHQVPLPNELSMGFLSF